MPRRKSRATVAALVETAVDLAHHFARAAARKWRVPLDEATSEAMAALHRAAESYNRRRGAWPMHAKVNIRRDVWAWSRRAAAQDAQGPALMDHDGATPSPERGMIDALDAATVAAALEQSPPEDKRLIRWHFGFDGPALSLRAIAVRLRCSHEQARTRLNLALGCLRAAVKRGAR